MQGLGVIGLKLIFNIWDGGSISAKHRQAIADKNISQLKLDQASKGMSLQLRNTISEYYSQIDVYKANKKAHSKVQLFPCKCDWPRSGQSAKSFLSKMRLSRL